MSTYFDELKKSMSWLASKEDTVFFGQAMFGGTGISNTLEGIDENKRIEFPVMENTQMGASLGMALNGTKVITIFPRFNFLLCAIDQLVNHVDKIKEFSHMEYKPSLIIRVAVGSEVPLHPQHQHIGNYSDAIRMMTKNIEVIELKDSKFIFPAYKKAYERTDGMSTLLVEFPDYYNL